MKTRSIRQAPEVEFAAAAILLRDALGRAYRGTVQLLEGYAASLDTIADMTPKQREELRRDVLEGRDQVRNTRRRVRKVLRQLVPDFRWPRPSGKAGKTEWLKLPTSRVLPFRRPDEADRRSRRRRSL